MWRLAHCIVAGAVAGHLCEAVHCGQGYLSAQTVPQVISNPAPSYASPTLRLRQRPDITLGGGGSTPETDIYGILDAAVTAAGGLVLLHASGERASLFGADGRHIRDIGRSGTGPGEFRKALRVATLPDGTIGIVSFENTVLRFGSDGRPLGQRKSPGAVFCCLADGSFLSSAAARRPERYETAARWPGDSAARIEAWRLLRIGDSDAQVLGTFRLTGDPPAIRFENRRPSYGPKVPVASESFLGVGDDHVVHANSARYEYAVFGRNGQLMRTVRAQLVQTPISSAVRADARERFRPSNADAGTAAFYDQVFNQIRLPRELPAFGDMQVEEDGSVWLRNYAPPWADSRSVAETWARFDSTGRLAGTLTIPASVRLIRFSRGRVVVSERDAATGFSRLWVHRVDTANQGG